MLIFREESITISEVQNLVLLLTAASKKVLFCRKSESVVVLKTDALI